MKLLKKNLNKEKVAAFFLSILIHGILILTIIFIKIEYFPMENSNYSVLNFVEVQPEKKVIIEKKKAEQKVNNTIQNQKQEPVKIKQQKAEDQIKTIQDTISNKNVIDSTINKGKIFISRKQLEDTTYHSLKFAATLLDSFLVRHPEYSKYILQEQAKELVENKNIKKFSRLALEQRINEELDKYLQQHYPEGSEHEINPYTGPGLQIPIDDLIDAIKKIF